jgi:branched-subunit amino acid permease
MGNYPDITNTEMHSVKKFSRIYAVETVRESLKSSGKITDVVKTIWIPIYFLRILLLILSLLVRGMWQHSWSRHYATSQKVAGLIPGFFN